MADDMSQGSDNSDYDADEDMCDDYYYGDDDDMETEAPDKTKDDPEYFDFELLKVEDVERLLNESVEALTKTLKVLRCCCSLISFKKKNYQCNSSCTN